MFLYLWQRLKFLSVTILKIFFVWYTLQVRKFHFYTEISRSIKSQFFFE